MSERPAVDVVVPSYRRPELLLRCLAGLAAQHVPAARVIVAARRDDTATQDAVRRHPGPRAELVVVDSPGVVAALAVAVGATSAEVVAFIDDDAVPSEDWLRRIQDHLSDAAIGAVGGRDLIPGQEGPRAAEVGRMRRWGSMVGNHHLGTGGARDVDVLKGVNMAWRATALALPADGVLRGAGAQPHYEVLMARWAQARGWRLRYDSDLLVHHLGADRPEEQSRVRPSRAEASAEAYNYLLATTAFDPDLTVRRASRGLLVGSRGAPGLVRAAVAAVRGERDVVARLGPSLAGQWSAFQQVRAGRTPRMLTCLELRDPDLAPRQPPTPPRSET